MTVMPSNRRVVEDAESEIRQRIGRNGVLLERIPTREKYIRYCEALVRNQSKPNAEAMLEAATWRLERTKASIVENEEAVIELEKAIAVLSNGLERRRERLISRETIDNHEFLMRFKISEYTGRNGVVKKSHIKYGYNL